MISSRKCTVGTSFDDTGICHILIGGEGDGGGVSPLPIPRIATAPPPARAAAGAGGAAGGGAARAAAAAPPATEPP